MKKKIKPLKNIHLYYVGMYYAFIAIFFDIGFGIYFLNGADVSLIITCIIINVLPLLVFAIVRIIYPYKYVVDDVYLTKYKGKQIVFRIKKEDIKFILVKRASFVNYVKFIVSNITFDNLFSTTNLTTISFLFDKYEGSIEQVGVEFKRNSLAGESFNNFEEYIEIMSYKDAKKISKYLGINARLV